MENLFPLPKNTRWLVRVRVSLHRLWSPRPGFLLTYPKWKPHSHYTGYTSRNSWYAFTENPPPPSPHYQIHIQPRTPPRGYTFSPVPNPDAPFIQWNGIQWMGLGKNSLTPNHPSPLKAWKIVKPVPPPGAKWLVQTHTKLQHLWSPRPGWVLRETEWYSNTYRGCEYPGTWYAFAENPPPPSHHYQVYAL